MQFTYILTIVATLGLARAQLPNLPECSLSCFLSALENDGCSGITNFTCHCAVPTLVSAITPCVQSACDLADQSSVSNAVTSACSSVSVPISIPPVSATTTGSVAATTSSGSGSTAPSKTSSSGSSTSTSSSGTEGASSTPGSPSTSGASASTSSSISTSTSTGPETTGTHTTTRSTTTSATQATGAAGSVSVPFVGTGLFAMGVAALFAL